MRMLFLVYKIEKDKGSEDAPSYNIIKRFIKKNNKITIISRSNNIKLLKKDKIYKKANLIPLEVPNLLSFYKKKNKGIILYYYLWQIMASKLVKTLQKKNNYDVIHVFNFHADWCPHFLKNDYGKLIWGPIGHHDYVPSRFIKNNKLFSIISEKFKYFVKILLWHFNPYLISAIKNSDIILYANHKLAKPFIKYKKKIVLQPYAGSENIFKSNPKIHKDFNILSVGRLENLKGFILTIDAFLHFIKKVKSKKINLLIIGSGSLKFEIQKIIDNNKKYSMKLIAWVDQKLLAKYYKKASVFIYPSFEAQGLVVAEALSSSLPVITLKNTGPNYLVGHNDLSVKKESYNKTIINLSKKLSKVYNEYNNQMLNQSYLKRAYKSRRLADKRVNWDVMHNNLLKLYKK